MILPLRQRHRRRVTAIAVLLPILFIAGIAARRPAIRASSLPRELTQQSVSMRPVWSRGDLFQKLPIRVGLFQENGTGHFALDFAPDANFAKPDVLVYWVQLATEVTDSLPDTAILLGAFTSSTVPLPDRSTMEGGRLILFSLADQEILDMSKPVQFSGPTR